MPGHAQEKWFCQITHAYKPYLRSWVVIFKEHILSDDIQDLGKNLIKWKQRPDLNIAVYWAVKRQFKQIQSTYIPVHVMRRTQKKGFLKTQHNH